MVKNSQVLSFKKDKSETLELITAGLLAAGTAIGAFIKIPAPFIPITCQLFFVLLAGNVLRPRFAFLTQLVYVLIGLSGVPVFANGGGPNYVLRPSFGYIIAFPIAATLISLLTFRFLQNGKQNYNKWRQVPMLTIFNLIGILIIFIVGVMYFHFILNIVTGEKISITTAFVTGMLLFLPGDVIKAIAAAFLAVKLRQQVQRG